MPRPEVISTNPEDGSTGFLPFKWPSLIFNQRVSNLTIFDVRIEPDLIFRYNYDHAYEEKFLMILEEDLQYGTSYRIEIDYGVEDLHYWFPNTTFVLEFTTLSRDDRSFIIYTPEDGFKVDDDLVLFLNGTSYGIKPGTEINIRVNDMLLFGGEIADNYTWYRELQLEQGYDEYTLYITVDGMETVIEVKKEKDENTNLMVIIILIVVFLTILIVLGFVFWRWDQRNPYEE
jgi:hypothetical protein